MECTDCGAENAQHPRREIPNDPRRRAALEAVNLVEHGEIARVWESRYEEGYKDGRGYTMHLVVLQAENHVAIRYGAGNAHDHINLSYDAAHHLAHALEDAVRDRKGDRSRLTGRVVRG